MLATLAPCAVSASSGIGLLREDYALPAPPFSTHISRLPGRPLQDVTGPPPRPAPCSGASHYAETTDQAEVLSPCRVDGGKGRLRTKHAPLRQCVWGRERKAKQAATLASRTRPLKRLWTDKMQRKESSRTPRHARPGLRSLSMGQTHQIPLCTSPRATPPALLDPAQEDLCCPL